MVPLAGYAPAADHYQWPALLLSDRGKLLNSSLTESYNFVNFLWKFTVFLYLWTQKSQGVEIFDLICYYLNSQKYTKKNL